MRSLTFASGFVAAISLVLSAGTASAAGGGTSGQQSGKGSSENRGGSGPQGGGDRGGSSGGSSAGPRAGLDPDLITPEQVTKKKWEVGGSWETHRLFRQEDLNGAGSNKLFNVIGASAQYDITQYDRVRVRAYLAERFIADSGETGFRLDDIVVSYTRRIPLPEKFTLRAGGWVTFPTSFSSEKSSLITAPRAYLDLEKRFGAYVTANLRGRGDAFITSYRTAQGGNYNPKYGMGVSAEVEVTMPFHTPLSAGLSAGTGYTWYYEPNTTADSNPQVQRYGTVGDPTFNRQPITQSYLGEIFVRYQLPEVVGIKADALVALANGDPSLGSQSVLHEGVSRFYLGFRNTAELYAAMTLRY